MHYKYKSLNRDKFDRGRSTYGPPGVTRIYHYAKSRMDSCPLVIDPPLNSLDLGGGVELSSSSITDCYSYDHQHASAKPNRAGDLVSRISISRKFTTGLCSAGWTINSPSLQPTNKKDLNQFNYCEFIITRRENHVLEGGTV